MAAEPQAKFRAGLANRAGLDSVGWVKSPVLRLARAKWTAPLSFTVDSFTIPAMILVY